MNEPTKELRKRFWGIPPILLGLIIGFSLFFLSLVVSFLCAWLGGKVNIIWEWEVWELTLLIIGILVASICIGLTIRDEVKK